MVTRISYGWSLPEAYHRALEELYDYGELSDCPDYNTTQLECRMTMIVQRPMTEPMISKLGIFDPRSLEQYRMEMLDGIMDFEVEKGNWHYTYHSRMADQVEFVIDELQRNPYSRRAVINIRDNTMDVRSENPACLQHIQYFIRNGKLECDVLFRSNDACKAAFMNAFALIMLQKRIADELGVKVGTYTHTANSFHCYEKDISMLKGYINRIQEADEKRSDGDLFFNYVGEWDELMEDERDDILKEVEELKNRG